MERRRTRIATTHNALAGIPITHPKIRVLLADDHAVLREGLTRLLQGESDIEVVGEATDGKAAIDLAATLLPDVILMDVSMPELNGIESTKAILCQYPGISIIGLSMFEEAERARAMRNAGAVNYLSKSGPISTLIAAIRDCRAGNAGRRQSA